MIKNYSASIGEFIDKLSKQKKKNAQLEVKRVTTKEFMEKARQAPIQKQGYLWCSDEHYHGCGGHLPVMAVQGYIVQEVKSHWTIPYSCTGHGGGLGEACDTEHLTMAGKGGHCHVHCMYLVCT